MKSAISRRLLLMASLAGAAFSLPGARDTFGSATAMPPSKSSVRTLFSTRAEILGIGRSYCGLCPAEHNLSVLEDLVSNACTAGDFNECFRKEFAAGETVVVGGWLVSRTEARYYALCYLETQSRG